MVCVLCLWVWISSISLAISQSISIPPLSVSIIFPALISWWRTPTVWASSCAKGQRISFVSITERRNITNKSVTNTPDSFNRWTKGCQLPPDNIQYKAVVSVREEDAVMGGSPGCRDVWLCYDSHNTRTLFLISYLLSLGSLISYLLSLTSYLSDLLSLTCHSSFPHPLHYDMSTPIVQILYIRLDTHL